MSGDAWSGRSGYVAFLIHYRWLIFAAATLLSLVAGHRTVLTYAALRSELEELLPVSAPSVTALTKLRERLPGIRHLGVVVAVDAPEALPAANRFVDLLAARLRAYPAEMIQSVRVDARAERVFAETYALQLMDPADVRGLREAVERRRDWDVSRQMGMDLEGDEPPAIPLSELVTKYEARYGKPRAGLADRFVSADGKSVVLLVQVAAHGTGYRSDAELLQRVQGDIAALGFPAAFHPALKVGYGGDVAVRVEEAQGLESDLTVSGLLVLALVLGSLWWFYRSLWAVPLLGLPMLYGALLCFGAVALPPLSILYLNSNTAFLGSIVVGNGINSGIILLARFQEERQRGLAVERAVHVAVTTTWKATLAAALAAATAYGSLVFTQFRGFNQFGWIGAYGLVLCWITAYTLGPILAYWWGARLGTRTVGASNGSPLTRLVLRSPTLVVAVGVVLLLVAGAGLVRRSGDWIEYDLSKLRRRDSWEHGERYWGKRMDAALGRYLTPTVVLPESAAEAREVEARVRAVQQRGGAGNLIDSVRSLSLFIPPGRDAALEEARELARVLTPRLKSQLSPRDRELVERALAPASLVPLTVAAIPPSLLMGLRENDGRVDRNVLVIPKLSSATWNAANLDLYARDLRDAAVVSGQARPVAGPLLLSSDIARAMTTDGPRATVLSLAAVLAICSLAFRAAGRKGSRLGFDRGSLGYSLAASASLLAGVLLMLGGLAWTQQKLNFSNFVALPITFGIAADYSINVLRRYQAEGGESLGSALSSTSGAVALCSATTIIGFGSLIMAQNQALFSFGVFAITGELTCLATAVVGLPAALLLWQRRRGGSSPREHAEPTTVSGLPASASALVRDSH